MCDLTRPVVPPSRLAHLRNHTRAAHASIETVPSLAQLMAPDLTRTTYTRILLGMLAFHAAVEPAIAKALEHLPDAQTLLDGHHQRALREDIAFLGATPEALSPDVPVLPDLTSGLGALYVVEGGNLGGRVIARHVSASLGVAPGAGGSFYGGLSAEAARARWSLLVRILEDQRHTIDLDALAESAGRVFACLERWMRRIPAQT
jgi:heme oxygenase (biliverdin-IX-beta and delta-forming)